MINLASLATYSAAFTERAQAQRQMQPQTKGTCKQHGPSKAQHTATHHSSSVSMQENRYGEMHMVKDAMQIAHNRYFNHLCVMFTCDSAAFTSLMLALVFNSSFTACSSTMDTLVLRRCSMTCAKVMNTFHQDAIAASLPTAVWAQINA